VGGCTSGSNDGGVTGGSSAAKPTSSALPSSASDRTLLADRVTRRAQGAGQLSSAPDVWSAGQQVLHVARIHQGDVAPRRALQRRHRRARIHGGLRPPAAERG